MKKAKILFFAADPHSAPPYGRADRLLLDEDIRQIREKVRASEHRDAFEFDFRLAARQDDLLQALNEVQPAVVHFSGHGWSEGLLLMDAHGELPQGVDRAHLAELFRVFRGQIRVVVLNACLSEPLADAVAQEVGCAIGMREKISDPAAIAFGAAFYRAIGFGRSVQEAFDQARLAVPAAERDCPQLRKGPGVDASKVFVLEPELELEPEPELKPRPRRVALAAVGVTGLVGAILIFRDPLPACARVGVPDAPAPPSRSLMAAPPGVESDLDRAKMDYEAGRYTVAFPRFRQLAENGDSEAMGYVGAMVLRGQGTVAQPDSGIYWLREAAYDRDPHAMTVLGFAYQNGEGVRKSLVRAREWYHKAVDEKQWPEAMRRLGALDRSEQKHDAALSWFKKAVKAGSVEARIDAGQSYEQGQGTPRDLDVAVCFYSTAAKGGSLRGMLIMGRIYRDGIGVAQDYDSARGWYENAARAGSPEGMQALGELYRDGLGVARDTAQAALWFRRASGAGFLN